MIYNKKNLEDGLFFLKIEAGEVLEEIREKYDGLISFPKKGSLNYNEIGFISLGKERGWNRKEDLHWYLERGYKEIFLHELEIEDYYEIY